MYKFRIFPSVVSAYPTHSCDQKCHAKEQKKQRTKTYYKLKINTHAIILGKGTVLYVFVKLINNKGKGLPATQKLDNSNHVVFSVFLIKNYRALRWKHVRN